jgi:hypothetical protein
MKKIAVYNSFSFHYEMFGFLIDFVSKYKGKEALSLTLFSNSENNMDWFRFYMKTFPGIFKLVHYSNFSPETFDYVFILTDDDPFWNDAWNTSKTFCIDHHSSIRRPSISYENHIGTRLFPSNMKVSWCLPVFRLINVDTKKQKMQKKIVCLGRNNYKIFDDTIDDCFEIILIDRDINEKEMQEKFKRKITCIKQCSTIDMIDHLLTAMYVFVSDNNKDHFFHSMSASIPLALDCLCTLVLPKGMNTFYNLVSVVEYDATDFIKLPTETSIESVDYDLEIMIKQRDNTINSLFCRW